MFPAFLDRNLTCCISVYFCVQTAGCGKPVVLIHGFGASLGHFRKNIPALSSAGYKVRSKLLLPLFSTLRPEIACKFSGAARC